MQQNKDVACSHIADDLAEIKDYCKKILGGVESIQRDVQRLKDDRHAYSERIASSISHVMARMSNISYVINELTAPGILDNYKIRHPEYIDTEPQEIYEELKACAAEIQGEVNERCVAFGKRLAELVSNRDPVQCLSDYVEVLKELRDETTSRRERLESLKKRRRNSDKGSNEQKNAAVLMAKVKSMLVPLEKFSEIVLDSFFKRRKSIISAVWRTTVAVEEMFESGSPEHKEKIPKSSAESSIASALKDLSKISTRHDETHRANFLVQTGNMSALERRKILAGLRS